MEGLLTLWAETGIANFEFGQLCMILVGCILLYLAIAKGFGAVLANIPNAGFTDEGGLLYYVYYIGIESGVFPLLIFMGVGAMTDFGALIANPKTLWLGAAAQFGIFATLFGAILLNYVPGMEFSMQDASSIAIIGGADGPTAIFLASQLSPDLLGEPDARSGCGRSSVEHSIKRAYQYRDHLPWIWVWALSCRQSNS
jgi:oxaloacetate decarboxylase beta subunit